MSIRIVVDNERAVVRSGAAAGAPALLGLITAHAGFSIVPHTWRPEKIVHDSASCAAFQSCGQQAVIFSLPDRRLENGSRRAATLATTPQRSRPHAH